MRRALFAAGLAAGLGALLILGYGVYSHSLTDPLVHVLGGIAGVGLVLAALMTDPATILKLVQQAVLLRGGGGSKSDGNSP